MRVAVFQHSNIEHAGLFGSLMDEWNIFWDVINLGRGGSIGNLDSYDAIVVLGGTMDVWEETEHPWLKREKKSIGNWVRQGRPLLGVCLGHQLLAEAVGGRVARMSATAIGVCDVKLTKRGEADPIFKGVAEKFDAIRWQGAHVVALPPRSECLALSPDGVLQAVRYGDGIYGIQFHAEMTRGKLTEWLNCKQYVDSLERLSLRDKSATVELWRHGSRKMSELNHVASLMFRNFVNLIGDRNVC